MPPSRGRYALAFTPLLVAVALVFAALQLYTAVAAARVGSIGFAILYGLMGVGGVALAVALLSARKRLKPPPD